MIAPGVLDHHAHLERPRRRAGRPSTGPAHPLRRRSLTASRPAAAASRPARRRPELRQSPPVLALPSPDTRASRYDLARSRGSRRYNAVPPPRCESSPAQPCCRASLLDAWHRGSVIQHSSQSPSERSKLLSRFSTARPSRLRARTMAVLSMSTLAALRRRSRGTIGSPVLKEMSLCQ